MTKRQALHRLSLKSAAGAVALVCLAGSAVGQVAGSGWIVDPRSGCATSNPFPKDGESIAWFGGCRDGKLDGPGLLIWYRSGFEAERDEGFFQGGELDGPATITFADGNSVRGDYRMGERHGEFLVHQRDGTALYRLYDLGRLAAERPATGEDAVRLQSRATAAVAPIAPTPVPAAPPRAQAAAPPAMAEPEPRPMAAAPIEPLRPQPAPPPLASLTPPPPPPPLPAPTRPSTSAAFGSAARSDVEIDLGVLASLRAPSAASSSRSTAPVKLRPPRAAAPTAATRRAPVQAAVRPAVFVDASVIDGLGAVRAVAAARPAATRANFVQQSAALVPDWYLPAGQTFAAADYTPAAAPISAVTPEILFAEGYRHERDGRMSQAEALYDTVYRLYAETPMAVLAGERLAWVRQQTTGLPMPQQTMLAAAGSASIGQSTTPIGRSTAPIPPATTPMSPATATFAPPQPSAPPVQSAQIPVAAVVRSRVGAYLCTVDGLYSNSSRWCGVVRREYDRYFEVEVSKVTIKTPLAVGFNSSACTGNKFIGYFSFGERVWVPQNCMAETL